MDGELRASVVIPVRNGANVLAFQLEALAQQTESDFEVIVSDNGSTDGTRTVACEWLDRLSHLRVVDSSGRPGVCYARNVGAAAATTNSLLFCDADDVVGPTWVSALSSGLLDHDVVGGVLDTTLLNTPEVSAAVGVSRTTELATVLRGLPYAFAGCMGVRRDTFLTVGGFDESFRGHEEADLSWRIQRAGGSIGFVPEAVVNYRLSSNPGRVFRMQFRSGHSSAQLQAAHPDLVDRPGLRSWLEPLLRQVRTSWHLVMASRRLQWLGGLGWTSGRAMGVLRYMPPSPVSIIARGVPLPKASQQWPMTMSRERAALRADIDPGPLAPPPALDGPDVTLVVACYNHRPFVETALRSAFSQEGVEVRVVVTDDASRDGSGDLIRTLVETHGWDAELILNDTNRGVCATLNEALRRVTTPYVAVMGGDDFMAPHRAARQVAALRAEPSAALLYGDMVVVREDGTRRCLFSEIFKDGWPGGQTGDVFEALLRGNFIPVASVMMRTDAVRAIGGYDERLVYEDYDLWLRLARWYPFAYLQEPLAFYRYHSGQHTESLNGPRSRERDATEFLLKAKHLGYRPDVDSWLLPKLHRLGMIAYRSGLSPATVAPVLRRYARQYPSVNSIAAATMATVGIPGHLLPRRPG